MISGKFLPCQWLLLAVRIRSLVTAGPSTLDSSSLALPSHAVGGRAVSHPSRLSCLCHAHPQPACLASLLRPESSLRHSLVIKNLQGGLY